MATDLSGGMVREGLEVNTRVPAASRVPFVQCDGRSLPFPDGAFDTVFTAYGVVPFVGDSDVVMAEAARVLRPGGRFVFSTTHPVRWAFADDPGPEGLSVRQSYFDRTPYVEQDDAGATTYVEHHRTLGDRVREITAAGLVLVDLVEPAWPEGHDEPWGAWSPLRGRLIPGTAIFVCRRRREASQRSRTRVERARSMPSAALPVWLIRQRPMADRPTRTCSVRCVVPGPAHPDIDVERHVHLRRVPHLVSHQRLDVVALTRGDLEHELVVHLEQDP